VKSVACGWLAPVSHYSLLPPRASISDFVVRHKRARELIKVNAVEGVLFWLTVWSQGWKMASKKT